jgi:hypothetical protein
MGAERTASSALVVVLLSATLSSSWPKEETGLELVAEACKNLTILVANKSPNMGEETCVSILRSDQRNAVTKDLGDLVLVAYYLMDSRVNDTTRRRR